MKQLPTKRILSFFIVLMVLFASAPLGVLADSRASSDPQGHVVLSFEVYDPDDQSVTLLHGPVKTAFGEDDTGLSLVQEALGTENVDGTSFINGLTIDGVTYGGDGDESGLTGYYWGLYLNNSPDKDYILSLIHI